MDRSSPLSMTGDTAEDRGPQACRTLSRWPSNYGNAPLERERHFSRNKESKRPGISDGGWQECDWCELAV